LATATTTCSAPGSPRSISYGATNEADGVAEDDSDDEELDCPISVSEIQKSRLAAICISIAFLVGLGLYVSLSMSLV
jgi:hypothetical protein